MFPNPCGGRFVAASHRTLSHNSDIGPRATGSGSGKQPETGDSPYESSMQADAARARRRRPDSLRGPSDGADPASRLALS